jgi:hypothetical protein
MRWPQLPEILGKPTNALFPHAHNLYSSMQVYLDKGLCIAVVCTDAICGDGDGVVTKIKVVSTPITAIHLHSTWSNYTVPIPSMQKTY